MVGQCVWDRLKGTHSVWGRCWPQVAFWAGGGGGRLGAKGQAQVCPGYLVWAPGDGPGR